MSVATAEDSQFGTDEITGASVAVYAAHSASRLILALRRGILYWHTGAFYPPTHYGTSVFTCHSHSDNPGMHTCMCNESGAQHSTASGIRVFPCTVSCSESCCRNNYMLSYIHVIVVSWFLQCMGYVYVLREGCMYF